MKSTSSKSTIAADRNRRAATLLAVPVLLLALVPAASGDTYPPDWTGSCSHPGAPPACHFDPVAWPADDGDGLLDYGDWVPYTMIGSGIEDNAVQDPSNGGTSPQNYVNISSGCTDLTLPSVFLYYDSASQVLMFRWRVEQIAHTYATGPSAQPASSVDPWKSALWTVLLDIDGDGYREYAVQMDGSSGTPGEDVDRMIVSYSDSPDQSVDYVDRTDICEVSHNPSAFTDPAGGTYPGLDGYILNFHETVTPDPIWNNGSGETLWDYGTTRARLLDQGSCIEYFVDYQIPLAGLDAAGLNPGDCPSDAPAVSETTPICVLFTTSNSLENPLQKDIVMEPPDNPGDTCVLDPSEPAPFGDCFQLADFDPVTGDLGTIVGPIVEEISTSGCGPATLTAIVADSVDPQSCYQTGTNSSSVASVQFYYYQDDDGNGLDDDGNSWTAGPSATEVSPGEWQTSAPDWDTTALRQGNILIGVRAEDDQGNITWSHLASGELPGATPPNYANPTDPGELFVNFNNYCGTYPTVTKAASVSEVAVGNPVDFTITVTAATDQALTLDQIDDFLPTGWTYDSDQGGTLSPTTSPAFGAGGTISWTFSPAVNIAAGASATLIFRATAPAVQGVYNNQAQAQSSNEGTLTSNVVEIGVGAPVLSIQKAADTLSTTPGSTITYTITYGNDSPVSVTNAEITDVLPTGLTFVSATDGGTYDSGTATITWTIGDLASGDSGLTVSFDATVDSPYPSGAANPLVNTATIDSDDTSPESASASTFIALPLAIQKSASSPTVAEGGTVTFTIDFENTGTTAATGAQIVDTLPDGFTYVANTSTLNGSGPPGFEPTSIVGQTVTWDSTVIRGAGDPAGTVSAATAGVLTFQATAASPYGDPNPGTNDAQFSATGLSPVSDTYDISVTGVTCIVPTTYYMRRTTGDVGFDGTQELANTTAPTNPTEVDTATVSVGPGIANIQELARFYQDPAFSDEISFNQDVTATMYVDKGGSPQAVFLLELFDYDPADGSTTSLGSNTVNVPGGGTFALTFTITQPGGTVAAGHRLLWVISAYNNHASQTNDVSFRYDGTSFQSRSDVCFIIAYKTAINVTVDQLSTVPGGTLTYTLEFANIGGSGVTNATLTDLLPAGVTYVPGSATINGVATSDPSISGQTLTWDSTVVAGNGDGAGTISAGNSGTLTFQVTVDNPATATSSTLVDEGTLSTLEAPDVTDTATTNLTRPNIVVTKAADQTLLVPGDTVTYTVTFANAGNAAAANPSMSDTLPVQAYFTYVAASCAVDATAAPSTTTTACSFTSPTLTATADTLAAGETLVVTFGMHVETVPAPPSGLTTYDNFATVANTTEPAVTATSNTVTVTISTNPNLTITIVADKATVNGDEVITYTITVNNIGLGDAEDVVVTNPIPDLTGYDTGTMTYDSDGSGPNPSVAQTDASGDDNAFYNAILNQLQWDLGTLVAGGEASMTFQVTSDSTFPAGSTTIDDTATVSASNAASKNDSESVGLPAPSLSVVKTAPGTLARPITTLNGNHNNTTTVNVSDATLFSVGDWIYVDGDVDTQITAISGNQLTVSVAINGNNGTDINPVIPYTILYSNTSDTAATNASISDDLPANTVFVTANNGGTHDGGSPGTVSWSLGTLDGGEAGSVKFWARPTTNDSFTNTAVLSSDDTADVNDSATTDVGTLTVTKSTSVPSVTSDPTDPKVTTTYTITVTNDSSLAADQVEVIDTLSSGFTFCDTTSVDAACNDPSYNPAATPATVPADGDAQPTWCCFSLAAGATQQITFDVKVGLEVGAGTYQNDVSVNDDLGTNQVPALTFDPLLTTAEDVTVSLTGGNYVFLKDFSAAVTDGGVELAWTTEAELGTVAFEVLRFDPQAGLLPVGDGELPAALSPQGAEYRLLDPAAPLTGPLAYQLAEVLDNGHRRFYGPFFVDPLAGAAGAAAPLTEEFAAVPRQGSVKAKPAPSAGLVGSDRGPGTGLRIGVREEGLYRVSAEVIDEALGLNAGEASSRIRSGKLLLQVDDVEVPWAAEGGGQASALLFYGRGLTSRYSNERIYRLLPQRGEGMKNASGGVRGLPTAGASFRDTLRFEEDNFPILVGAYEDNVEFWFWDYYLSGSPTWGSHTYTLDAPGAVAGAAAGDGELTVVVQGVSMSLGGQHRLEATWNGVALGEGRFRHYDTAAFTFTIPAGLVMATGNTLEIEAFRDPGVTISTWTLDHLELTYDRDFVATTPAFAFAGEAHEQLVVDGFDDSEILLLDITDPTDPRQVRGAEIEPGTAGPWQVRFSPAAPGGRYLATVGAGIREPSSIEVDHPSSLRDGANWTDYLVITAGELYAGAETLAAHREGQGLVSRVVDVDDIMDEFNGGQLDPAAIRAFLAYTASDWLQAPRYVALVGEGTIDYKDVRGLGTNLLPPLLAAASWGLYPSDNRLADIDDDGVPDFAIGRLSASTAGELAAVVGKIVAYETAPDAAWMSDVVLLADDPDATGDYTATQDLLSAYLPPGAVAHRIYLEDLSPASATAELLARFASGTPLINFAGHAGLTQLTHEAVLSSAHVPGLTNGERLPVLSALACNLGHFAVPGFSSLAEELVLHPDGGASAVWTAAGLSYNPRRVVIGEAFLRSLQGGTRVLGDAVLEALISAAADRNVDRETLESQVLIGDPALRLRIAP